MNLQEIATHLGAVLVVSPGDTVRITRVFAGDVISRMLSIEPEETLVVTNLSGTQLMNAARLMDVPCLCLVGGRKPDSDMIEVAHESGIGLMVSPLGLFETCGRLYGHLSADVCAARK